MYASNNSTWTRLILEMQKYIEILLYFSSASIQYNTADLGNQYI